jgi:hypothetical protein
LSESEILEILSSTGDANEMESLGTGEEQPIGTGGIEGENEGTGISESVVVEKPKSTPPSVNGGILGVELTFEEPVLKVKLGGKEF